MFSGFEDRVVDVGATTIFSRRKGIGRPLLLLHGFPQTHLMWHRVAPALSESFAVVCADLRGYGASGTPASSPDHSPYSKQEMAQDMVQLMEALGFPRFSVAGHDRGGRVAYRMALDHPERIDRLALLDMVPTGEVFRRADARLALEFWPWSLLAQPEPLPERLIAGDPAAVIDDALGQWGSDPAGFPSEVRAAYVDALRDPKRVHAICEEYRACSSIDATADAMDRKTGRRISCPVLVLWSKGGSLDRWYDDAGGPLGVWGEWADDPAGGAVAGGHFFPEQNPVETIARLAAFFGEAGGS